MADPRRHRRWRRWLVFTGRSPYPARVQIVCTSILLAWLCAGWGIPYAFGVTWPWHYAELTGPALVLVLYVPMASWLDRRDCYDADRLRPFDDAR